ncbi:MAG: SPOR domain-containing protein [Melioribacteraceae bacterium]
MKLKNYYLLIPIVFLFACTSTEQTAEQSETKSPEVYVFDDVKKAEEPKIAETPKVEEPKTEVKPELPKVETTAEEPVLTGKKFTIQIGAFTTKDRAEIFIKEHQTKTSLPLNITLNGATNLFVVQVPPYKTKEEADLIRDNLRKFAPFKDAFTVSVER